MRLGFLRSALWPISDLLSTNSAPIRRRKTTSNTFALSCVKLLQPCRRISKNLRFLMTANTKADSRHTTANCLISRWGLIVTTNNHFGRSGLVTLGHEDEWDTPLCVELSGHG